MLPETMDVDVETESVDTDKVNDGKVDMSNEDSETSKESSAETTEETDATEKVEKTDSKDKVSEESQDDEVVDDGKPIPYKRFKSVIDGRNALKTELETLRSESEEMAQVLSNPDVVRAILKSQGITDPAIITKKMKEAGFTDDQEKPKGELYKQFAEGLDLSKQESWFSVMERMFEHFSKKAIEPISEKLTQKEKQDWISTQETEAKKIAKEQYGLEYGQSGKDEKNINTAVGKIWKYLEAHPEDAGLGHTKLLHLALAPEAKKLGEQEGVKKEKERHKSLKDSAMEDDAQVGAEETPNADWPVSKLMAYRRKYGK